MVAITDDDDANTKNEVAYGIDTVRQPLRTIAAPWWPSRTMTTPT